MYGYQQQPYGQQPPNAQYMQGQPTGMPGQNMYQMQGGMQQQQQQPSFLQANPTGYPGQQQSSFLQPQMTSMQPQMTGYAPQRMQQQAPPMPSMPQQYTPQQPQGQSSFLAQRTGMSSGMGISPQPTSFQGGQQGFGNIAHVPSM